MERGILETARTRVCQMVCFQTKKNNLGKIWGVLQWKILVYFIIIWSTLRTLEIVYGYWVYFVVIWYITPQSGNPGENCPKSLHT
jgi:hypothetical protein